MKTPAPIPFVILTTLFTLSSCLRADPEVNHLDVGDPVPAGTLRTEVDAEVNLPDLAKGKPSVLIFYRGGWCPYCLSHLKELADIVPALAGEGWQIVAISPDRPAKLREKPDLGKLPYTLLSDSSMRVSSAFGISFQVEEELVDKYKQSYGIDLEGDSGETHHLLPHPSVFLVDGNGIIRFAHVDPDYKKRMDPEKVLEAARGLK